MDAATSELLELLNLESMGQGVFVGPPSHDKQTRVFGGQVLAQALAAASFTVDGASCHSLHAYFLRPGKPGRPIEYEVAKMRDGQSLSQRKVIAVQRVEPIVELVASFYEPPSKTGSPIQHSRSIPEVPGPETFPDEEIRMQRLRDRLPEAHRDVATRKRPIEMLRIGDHDLGSRTRTTEPVRSWIRVRSPLPDDPNLHRCLLAYASDFGALEPSLRAIGGSFGDLQLQVASLDHAMWFHRPFRCDEWLLVSYESASVGEDRGLSYGSVWSQNGRLVASIAQEGMVRPRGQAADDS